ETCWCVDCRTDEPSTSAASQTRKARLLPHVPEESAMSSTLGMSLVAAIFLALVHAFSGSLHRGAVERPRWMAAASGLSLAYVFVHVLPELAEVQARWLEDRPQRSLTWFENQIYIMALIGVLLALLFGRGSATARGRSRIGLRIGAFAVYNMLIGGLTLRLGSVVSLM